MFAQYSPLFTSGLLSDSSPSSSRSASPKRRFRSKKPNHDSLPVTVNSATFSIYTPHSHPQSSDSAFYLTLKPSRRRQEEGHSFLSLDLADTHRSMSLRRKDTVTSRATSLFGRSEPVSPVSPLPAVPSRKVFTHSHVSSASSTATVVPRVTTPVLRRTSRETLRLPSPKPAPSISLPDVPAPVPAPVEKQTHRRRPSNLTLTFSSCFPDIDISSPSMSYHRPTYSAPCVLSPSLTTPLSSDESTFSYFAAFSPTTSTPPTPPPTTTRPDSFVMPAPMSAPVARTSNSLRASPSMRSTVSMATRQRNRSAALAALEGRTGRPRRASSVKRNFMSMSDDEDEENEEGSLFTEAEDGQNQKGSPLLSVLDEEESVMPSASGLTASSSASPSRTQSRRASRASASASKRASVSSETKRSRRRTIESFFAPLTNFIDLRDDDSRSTRSWRSFVQISS